MRTVTTARYLREILQNPELDVNEKIRALLPLSLAEAEALFERVGELELALPTERWSRLGVRSQQLKLAMAGKTFERVTVTGLRFKGDDGFTDLLPGRREYLFTPAADRSDLLIAEIKQRWRGGEFSLNLSINTETRRFTFKNEGYLPPGASRVDEVRLTIEYAQDSAPGRIFS